jgi:hypothetical protein
MLTIDHLGLSGTLRRCLGTTNRTDNSHSAARDYMRRVKNWQSDAMALRWPAAALATASQHFRRITVHEYLWMLRDSWMSRHEITCLFPKPSPDNLESQLVRHHFPLPAGHHPRFSPQHATWR